MQGATQLQSIDLFELMRLQGSARQKHPKYRLLLRNQNFANAMAGFKRACITHRNPKLPSPFPGAKEYVETKIIFCVLDCIFVDQRLLGRRLTKKQRQGGVKAIKKLTRVFRTGIQLPDSEDQGQLEFLLRRLLDLQEKQRPRRTYVGPKVRGRKPLSMLANTMITGFWWCSPEFLSDVASMAGIERDLSTFNRYIAAVHVENPGYRLADIRDGEVTPEQHEAILTELERLGVRNVRSENSA